MEGGVGQVWDPNTVARLRLRDRVTLNYFLKLHFFEGQRQGWWAVLLEQAQRKLPPCP